MTKVSHKNAPNQTNERGLAEAFVQVVKVHRQTKTTFLCNPRLNGLLSTVAAISVLAAAAAASECIRQELTLVGLTIFQKWSKVK